MTTAITFLTDYGLDDEFVGVCHGVIAKLAPAVRVIDLGHGFRGVRAASAALAQSVAYCPPAVHLAVVDPGVGTARRGVIVVSASGAPLVGPDNGLLVPAAEALGGIREVFELAEPAFRLEPLSSTFHGRDVFAPAAAHLAVGASPVSFGPAASVPSLVRLTPPHVEASDGRLCSDVLRSDRFGNLQLAATTQDLAEARLPEVVTLTARGATHAARLAETFALVEEGALLVYGDSAGHVGVAVNLGSADRVLGSPERVWITRLD